MTSQDKPRVLVTGMSGLIGQATHRILGDKYRWRALNRRDVPGVETVQADIADFDAIQLAFEDVDVVVHLAAIASLEAPWEEILHHNIEGTYNVFEAARQAGVKRVVFASSGATVAAVQAEEPYKAIVEGRYSDTESSWPMITHESMVRPMGLYGVSKVFGEVLGRHFVDSTPMSVLCIRLGWVGEEDKPSQPAHWTNWTSQRDIVQMIERCIDAPESLRYDIFFCTSDNRWSYRDLAHAKQVLGFEPQDRAEDHRP